MPKGIKRCRVCGREYEACHSLMQNEDKFRWQDVACSVECGSKYFTDILTSRGESLDSLPECLRPNVDKEENSHTEVEQVEQDHITYDNKKHGKKRHGM